MFSISPQWVLKQLGLDGAVDPEVAEMVTLLVMRYQNAPDKAAFAKETLRKALLATGGVPTAPMQPLPPAMRKRSR